MRGVSAKILVFGEYAILKGGNALAMPFDYFSGTLNKQIDNSERALKSNKVLQRYAAWTEARQHHIPWLNIDTFKKDVKFGLWFQSDIPNSSGLGSSGALTAALYDAYADSSKIEWSELRGRLSTMESFFHGSSSGIDPLVCLLHQAVHIQSNGIQSFQLPDNHLNTVQMFLLPNAGTGKTAELVQEFNSFYKGDFKQQFETEYLPINKLTISHFMENNVDFGKQLKKLSEAQMEYFSFVLDKESKGWMQEGLQSGMYTLKLCGSGGGGYLLGFTEHMHEVQKRFPQLIRVS